jgi:hypothetical protein
MALPALHTLEEHLSTAETMADLASLTAQILAHVAADSKKSADQLVHPTNGLHAFVGHLSSLSKAQETIASHAGESLKQHIMIAENSTASTDHMKHTAGKSDELAWHMGRSAGAAESMSDSLKEVVEHARQLNAIATRGDRDRPVQVDFHQDTRDHIVAALDGLKPHDVLAGIHEAIRAGAHLVSGTLGVQLREVAQGLSAINRTALDANEILHRSHEHLQRVQSQHEQLRQEHAELSRQVAELKGTVRQLVGQGTHERAVQPAGRSRTTRRGRTAP